MQVVVQVQVGVQVQEQVQAGVQVQRWVHVLGLASAQSPWPGGGPFYGPRPQRLRLWTLLRGHQPAWHLGRAVQALVLQKVGAQRAVRVHVRVQVRVQVQVLGRVQVQVQEQVQVRVV